MMASATHNLTEKRRSIQMKRTVKLLSIAALAGLTLTPAAHAEGFDVGADVVSRYVWRGTQFGDGIAAQPWLSYTFPGIGVEVGAWGSFEIDNDDNNEIDLYVTVPAGNFSFTLTDYYFPTLIPGNDYFNYGDDDAHVLEASIGYEYDKFSLLAAYNLLGNECFNTDDALYVEAGYNFYDKDGYSASVFVGGGNEVYTTDGDFDIVNVGVSVSKDIFNASYIVNPDLEEAFFVVGVTLQP
jgi:hypothetical protein